MQTLATRPSGWVGYCICKISHLLDGGGNLLGYDVMKSNFQDLNWLEFCGIVSAVKSFINKLQNEPMCNVATSTAIDLVLLERYHIYSSVSLLSLFKLNSIIEIEGQKACYSNSSTVFSNKWKLFLI